MSNPFEQKIENEWEQFQRQHEDELYPNVMLLGASGVGKSSLINTVFGRETAPVSHTSPKTQGYCTVYRGRDHASSVNLIDTAGYELGLGGTYYGSLQQTIRQGFGEGPVHVVWYCIAVTNESIQDMDLETLRQLSSEPEIRSRVLTVFTKCDEDTPQSDKARALAAVIHEEIGPEMPVFETSSLPGFPLELPSLVSRTAVLFDDTDLRENFLAAQMADISAKRAAAQQTIGVATAAAAVIGAIPITFADAALLVPTQVAMVGKIVDVFGLRSLTAVSQTLVGNVVISQLGKSLASGIAKLIPVVGPLISGAVDAAVAGAITYALGTAAAEVCAVNTEKALRGQPVAWNELFTSPEFLDLVQSLFVQRLPARSSAGLPPVGKL
ncbi:MAG: DUF697 domain-containing protein [Clostridia bacterium]|nr:DUF697 domain-containing protein [Clostridia bacterium]